MNLHRDCTSFEQGPIRPPSEARSLLIRVTRNCPWNRCAFCHTYQGERFSLRSVAEIKEEIRRIGRTVERIRALSGESGEEGNIGGEIIPRFFDLGQGMMITSGRSRRGSCREGNPSSCRTPTPLS